MRCHYCDNGVLQITALTPPDEGWAVGCNKCDYSTWMPAAKHSLDCLWHRDWHACNCGFFDGEEESLAKARSAIKEWRSK